MKPKKKKYTYRKHSAPLTIRMESSLRSALKLTAAREGLDVSQLVRDLITEYVIKKRESVVDAALKSMYNDVERELMSIRDPQELANELDEATQKANEHAIYLKLKGF